MCPAKKPRTFNPEDWFVDSGATRHMTGQRSLFSSLNSGLPNRSVATVCQHHDKHSEPESLNLRKIVIEEVIKKSLKRTKREEFYTQRTYWLKQQTLTQISPLDGPSKNTCGVIPASSKCWKKFSADCLYAGRFVSAWTRLEKKYWRFEPSMTT